METNSSNNSLKTLASGALLSLFFGVIGYLLMFVFKVFSARIFGPEKFGMFEMGTTLLNIGALASLLGVQAGIGRYVSIYEERGDFKKLKGYLYFIFRLPILMSIIISALVFILAPFIRDFFNFDSLFITMMRIIALIIPFRVINEIIYQIFYAKGRVLIQNTSSNVVERIIPLIGLVFVYFYKFDVVSLMWLMLLSIFMVSMFNYFYYKFRINFKKIDGVDNDYLAWLKFSAPLFFANIFAFLINWTDNIAIGKIMTSKDVGIYAVSFSLASFLLFFQTSFSGIFFPVISRLYAQKKNEEISFIYGKAQNWAFGMALPFALIFIFFAREILFSIYGSSFSFATIPLIILTIGFIFNVYAGMNPIILKLVKKTQYIFNTKIFLALANVVLMIILINKFGILGAAISVSFIVILEQFIYMIKARKYFKIFHNNLTNLKLLLVGVTLIIVIERGVVFLGCQIGIFQLVIISIAYLASYFSIALFAKIFDENDVIIFKKILRNEQ